MYIYLLTLVDLLLLLSLDYALYIGRSSIFRQYEYNFHLQSNKAAIPIQDRNYDNIERNPSSGAYNFSQWEKAFRSQPNEYDYDINLEDIEGIIPNDINGSLFRNMPALFERGNVPYVHYLDGDGYVIKVSFHQGKVHFRSRFIQTDEFKREQEVNRTLFRSSFRTQRKAMIDPIFGSICFNNAFDLYLKNLANTNVVYHHNKLLALFEAGVPYELDPNTLETIGMYNFNLSHLKPGIPLLLDPLNDWNSNIHSSLFGCYMTAHPKFDPFKRSFISWIWRAKASSENPLKNNPALEIYEWDEHGNLMQEPMKETFISTTVAPHDFSLTFNYYCFIENRVSGDILPYLFGTKTAASCVDIEYENHMILNLLNRKSGEKKSISLENPGFSIHSATAFEENQKLYLYTSGWCIQTISDGKVQGGLLGSWEGTTPLFDNIPCTYLYETIVDLKDFTLIKHGHVKGMENVVIEHPHINPKYESSKVRYLYMSIGSVEGKSSPPLGYMRLDLITNEKQIWYAPIDTYCEEVVLIPKLSHEDNKHYNQEEDDLWMIVTMFDAIREKSCICIFDGKNISFGPISRIWLQHHLPHSLHGSFVHNLL